MYEGEVVLAEQVDKVGVQADETKDKIGFTRRQGRILSLVNYFLYFLSETFTSNKSIKMVVLLNRGFDKKVPEE